MSYGRMILGLWIVVLVTFSGVTVCVIPQSDGEALENAVEYSGGYSSEFTWDMPIYDTASRTANKVVPMTFDMEISYIEFRKSMYSSEFRMKTVFEKSASAMIDPGDPYVQKVAQYIQSLTGDYTDYQRINTALYFVQTAINYGYDIDIYGLKERWAAPIETLYLKYGDCEDASVLFVSIMKAMGYDAVLLQYDGHVAAGVDMGDSTIGRFYSDGEKKYMFCECAADGCRINAGSGLSYKRYSETPEIIDGHVHGTAYLVGNAYYTMRNLTYYLTGI